MGPCDQARTRNSYCSCWRCCWRFTLGISTIPNQIKVISMFSATSESCCPSSKHIIFDAQPTRAIPTVLQNKILNLNYISKTGNFCVKIYCTMLLNFLFIYATVDPFKIIEHHAFNLKLLGLVGYPYLGKLHSPTFSIFPLHVLRSPPNLSPFRLKPD